MSKSYFFNGVEFKTEKNVLKIQNAWLPLKIYYDKVVNMFASEVDMSAVNVYRDRIKKIVEEKDIPDNKDLLALESETVKNEPLIKQVKESIAKNKTDIENIEKELLADEKAQAQQSEYNKALENAIQYLLCSDIIPEFLDKYLIGDKSKLDYENPEMITFINEVVGDFFLLMLANIKK